jgi:putative transposase
MKKTEIINIKFNSEIDSQSFLSKNLYNYANFILRKEFIENKKFIGYYKLNDLCKNNENYKSLPSQTAQNILMTLCENWKSFFKAIKDWSKNKNKYLGKPNLPKYKNKNGRNILIYPFQNLRIKNNEIKIPKTNFKFKIRNEIKDKKINQIRIIPMASNYKIEVIYEIKEKEIDGEIKNVLSIDLGLNNLSTCTNNIGLQPFIINGKTIKSINQFYNKKTAKLKSLLINNKTSKNIKKLTQKRNNKINDYLHKSSNYIIKYCISKKLDTIIIGYNKEWKQEMNLGKKNNQNFVQIPYLSFINKLKYKGFENGIKVILNEESYTSKCDALGKEEIKKHDSYLGKRIKRGLFQSSINKLINADVNGSMNIMRKVIGDDFIQPIEGLMFNPIKINNFNKNFR